MNDQIQLLRRYVRMVWPYRWGALAGAALISIIGWGVVLYIPNEFEVSAKIFVDTRSMLRPLLRGLTINDDNLASSALLMKQTLLTRPNLEAVARKTDLDLKAQDEQAFDKIVISLAKQITLTGTDKDNIYEITVKDNDPQKAKRVVDELLNTFLETALGSTRKDSAVTQKFLDEQIAEYEKRLTEAEERLKEFKQKNAEMMSREGESYFTRMQQERSLLAEAELQLHEAENRAAEIRRQTEGEEPVFGIMNETQLGGGLSSQYDSRIASLKAQLDQLNLQYTERHPDIMAIKQTIADLEKKRDEEIAAAAAAAANEPAQAQGLNENPFYRDLKMSLAQAEADVAGLSTRVAAYRARVSDYEKKVNTVPEIEAELKRLDRDYGLNKEQYDELLKRRESARLSQEADSKSDDIKLKVIEPPRIPLVPIGPDRVRFLTLVFIASLAVGGGMAFLLSQINPRFYAAEELKEFSQLPIIGVVSMVSSRLQRTERRMELAVFSLVFLGLVAVFATLVSLESLEYDLHSHVAKFVGNVI